MSKRNQAEFHEQCKFYNWCVTHQDAEELPDLDLIFAVPNGAHLAKGQGSKLIKEGMRKGVPDMCLPVPRAPFHGLWIEMKRPAIKDYKGKIIQTAGTSTEFQKKYKLRLDSLGYKVCVCYGKDEAKIAVLEYYNVDYGPKDFM